MGKQKIEATPNYLLAQIRIASVLYAHKEGLTIDDLVCIMSNTNYTNNLVKNMLGDLVGYGVVSAGFDSNHDLKYTISAFGKYFFDELIETNKWARELFASSGDD